MNNQVTVPRKKVRNDMSRTARIGLSEVVGTIRRHMLVILALTIIGAVVSFVAALQRPSTYTAESTVVLQAENLPMQDIFERLGRLEVNRSMVETQMDILRSRQLLGKVADELQLVEDPNFNLALRQSRRPLLIQIAETLSLTGWIQERASEHKAEQALRNSEAEDHVAAATGDINTDAPAESDLKANVAELDSTEDPASGQVADFVSPTNWFDDQLVDLVEEDAARSAGATIEEQREFVITELERRLAIERTGESLALSIFADAHDPARAARIANTLARVYIEKRLESRRQEIEAASKILRQRVTDLADKLAETEQRIAWHVREARLDDLDYEQELRAEITQLQARLAISPDESETQKQTRHELSNRISALENELMERTLAVIRREQLERELETDRRRHQQMVERLSDLDTETRALRPGADIVSFAEPPREPSSMQPATAGVLGGIGFFLMGTVVAFFLAAADTRVRSAAQLEECLDLPCLSAIPALGSYLPALRDVPPHKFLLNAPRSAFAEALRRTCLSLLDGTEARRSKTLAVTSSLPGEGKTMIAVCLGVASASLGHRVAVIDLDLHKTGMSGLVLDPEESDNSDTKPGLSEWFQGRVDLQQAAHTFEGHAGLDVYASERIDGDLSDILSEDKLQELFAYLKASYDVIIVDTPPIMLVSDLLLLRTFIDGVLVVARWEEVTENVLHDLSEVLMLNGISPLGAVLNRVDPRKQRKSGTSDRQTAYYEYGKEYY